MPNTQNAKLERLTVRELQMRTYKQHGSLPLGLIEMIAQNNVHEIGLRDAELVGGAFNKLLILVRDDEWLVLRRKRPGAHIADEGTPHARIALVDVALLAEGLPVPEVVRPAPQARNFVIRAELHGRFLPATGRALVVVLLLKFLPLFGGQLGSRLALLAHIQALQLVLGALLPYRGEALLALELAQTPEHVPILGLAFRSSEGVHRGADLLLRQDGAWDSVARRPERFQKDGVDGLVRLARLDEPSGCIRQPRGSARFGFVRRSPRRKEKALAGAGFSHLGAGVK